MAPGGGRREGSSGRGASGAFPGEAVKGKGSGTGWAEVSAAGGGAEGAGAVSAAPLSGRVAASSRTVLRVNVGRDGFMEGEWIVERS